MFIYTGLLHSQKALYLQGLFVICLVLTLLLCVCLSCWTGDSDPLYLLLCLKSQFYRCLSNWVQVLWVLLRAVIIYGSVFKLLRYMSSLICYIFKVLESREFAFFSCNYYAEFKTMSCIYSCSWNISETIITFVEYFIFYQVLPYLLAHWVSQ